MPVSLHVSCSIFSNRLQWEETIIRPQAEFNQTWQPPGGLSMSWNHQLKGKTSRKDIYGVRFYGDKSRFHRTVQKLITINNRIQTSSRLVLRVSLRMIKTKWTHQWNWRDFILKSWRIFGNANPVFMSLLVPSVLQKIKLNITCKCFYCTMKKSWMTSSWS